MAVIYQMTDTWNGAGQVFTAIKMDVTDTASDAASKLLDLRVNGATMFSVRKDGLLSPFTMGTLVIQGDATLGDSAADFIVMNGKSITRPNAPAFLAFNSVADAAVTGDGTQVTVEFDTELYDRAGEFAANTHTVTVAGIYTYKGCISLNTIAVGHTDVIADLITTGRTIRLFRYNLANVMAGASPNGVFSQGWSVDAEMQVGNTATVRVQVSGAAKAVGIVGGSNLTYFGGVLLG